jgi:hypothetical protein
MAERTSAERNWQQARQEEQQARREGELFRSESQRGREGYREGSYGGGYQPASYEQTGGRGYGGGWQSSGPFDYTEGPYGQGERGYGRPPGFRYQGTGYGASAGYNPEFEGSDWSARPGGEGRPGSFGARGREGIGQRGGSWPGQWRGGEGGWATERGFYGGGAGWRAEAPWEQERDLAEESGWGGAGFRGGYGSGAGFTGQTRGGSGFTRWQGEGSWRGGGAPGYPGSWGPEWGWQGGQSPAGYTPEPGFGAMPGRGGYAPRMRGGWSGGEPEWEPQWGGRGAREWGEPGRAMSGIGYGEPWNVPGPFSGLGPQGYRRSGDSIRDDVCERLTLHGHIDAGGIRVRIEGNNEVVLEGTVPDRRTKRLAEDVAESVSGVRDVQNRLRVIEREESRGSGAGMRGEVRDERESEEIGEAGHTGRGAEHSDEMRGGRPERDAEKQKASARTKT